MSEPANVSPIEKTKELYLQLAQVAQDLNSASDELGAVVSEWDAALKRLNLGTSAWIAITVDEAPLPYYNVHQLGYDKIEGKWCVGLRHIWGREDDALQGESGESELWAFNDSPRWLRILAIDKMPALLAELMNNARATGEDIREKLTSARAVATSIRQLAEQRSSKSK